MNKCNNINRIKTNEQFRIKRNNRNIWKHDGTFILGIAHSFFEWCLIWGFFLKNNVYVCSIYSFFPHNIYVEGLLFSRPWVCRDRIAGIEFFRPPRGTRDSVVVVVILYLAVKLIHWLVLILCSWAVFFVWNPIITTQRYYIQKSNIQHWDRNNGVRRFVSF